MDIADELVDELEGATASGRRVVAKLNYSHEEMVRQILTNPGVSQNQLAAMFGYTPGWISQVLSSDAFQARLAEVRDKIEDPILIATIKERTEALYLRSLQILQEKLDRPATSVPDSLALKAAELGARGVGIGGFGKETTAPPPPPDTSRLERLVQNLDTVMHGRLINGQATEIEVRGNPVGGEEGRLQ